MKTNKIDSKLVDGLKADTALFGKFIEESTDKELTQVLGKFGKLNSDFDTSHLVSLVDHKSPEVRRLAIKNLAKTKDKNLLSIYTKILDGAYPSDMQREAVSAIGRMRDNSNIKQLLNLLTHRNPEVTMQAIRGLLVFKHDKLIRKQLKNLIRHPNEIIQTIIRTEFGKKKTTTPHATSPLSFQDLIVNDDVAHALKDVPEDSIHLTFTSPPYYNARDYSTYTSYKEYLQFLAGVFREVYRVTKEGRYLVVNTSPIIIPRAGRKYSSKRYAIPYDLNPILTKMGWEFMEDIIWLKPEASAKNRVSGFSQHRKPLTYKPNCCTENVMVYRKRSARLIDWNLRQYDESVMNDSKIGDGFESSNVWTISPAFDKTHSAVFPIELCDRVVTLYSMKGDLVFDPFAGSGTFGVSAAKNGRKFFLTELDQKYYDRIKENLNNHKVKFTEKVSNA